MRTRSCHTFSRLTRRATVVAALVASAAQAAVPVGIYPVQAEGLSTEEAKDVAAVLESALRSGARRDVLVPRSPALLPASCPAPPTTACLARLAGDGAVLHVRARRAGGNAVVTVALVDGKGRRTQSYVVSIELAFQNPQRAEPVLRQIELEIQALAAGHGAQGPTVTSAGAAAVVPPPPPAPRLETRTQPTGQASVSAEGPPGQWMATAGKWTAAGGAVLVVGGVVAAVMAKNLSNDLTTAYGAGTLTPADASSYDRVQTYNTAANALLIVGGAAVVTGLTLWGLAPDAQPTRGGASFRVSGRF